MSGRAGGWIAGAGVLVGLLGAPSRASAAITVSIAQPTQNQLVNTASMNVTATVTSDAALQTVQAQVGAAGQALTSSAGSWSGTVSLSSIQPGVQTLTVTATDVNDATGSARVAFVYDLPPVVTIASPVSGFVARPQASVVATCADTDSSGCTSLNVTYEVSAIYAPIGILLASGVSSVDQVVDLSAYGPSAGGQLTFTASDTYVDTNSQVGHQSTSVSVTVEIDSTSTLNEVEVVSGTILDADSTRLLVLDPDGATVKTYDRSSQQYTVIATGLPLTLTYPIGPTYLIPGGALLELDNPEAYAFPFSMLYEWQGGQLSLLDHPNTGNWLAVAGQYALWCDDPNLILRDLTTGMDTTISTSAGNINNGVASNGDVVWGGHDGQIHRSRGGVQTQLTSNPYGDAYPLTDGVNVVYEKGADGGASYSTALFGAGGEVLLDPSDQLRRAPWLDYQVSGGWIAYTAPWGGAYQVFLYDPSGVTHRLTEFGSDSTIEAMDSSGGVMFLRGFTWATAGLGMLFEVGSRYFASPTMAPVFLGGSEGNAISIDGAWYLMLGNSLFSLAICPGGGSPEAGACGYGGDAGSSDAASDDGTVQDASGEADTANANDGGGDGFEAGDRADDANVNESASDALAGIDGSSSDATVRNVDASPESGATGPIADASNGQSVGASEHAGSGGGPEGGGCSVSVVRGRLSDRWGALLTCASVLAIVRRRRARRKGIKANWPRSANVRASARPRAWLLGAGALIGSLGFASTAFAAITVEIYNPLRDLMGPPNWFINATSMQVTAIVTSDLALQTVHAQVDSAGQDLVFSVDAPTGIGANEPGWSGVISLASVPLGVQTLTVTATDVNGATGSSQVTFAYDLPPVVTVTSPARWSVARPTIRVAATCTDANSNGCTSLTVGYEGPPDTSYPGETVASGVSSINQVVDLSAYDPSAAQLTFTASDTYLDENGQIQHQGTSVAIDIEVDSSATLNEVEVAAGDILDADCTRLLVLDPDEQTIKIYDRGTQQYTVIATGLPIQLGSYSFVPFPSYLTAGGALFDIYNSEAYAFPFSALYEWRNGQLSTLDHPYSSIAVGGQYAVWSDNPSLILRDLMAGTSTAISTSAGNVSPAVAPNGDVVWSGLDGQIYRIRDGVQSQLTSGSNGGFNPLSDGINVVYAQSSPTTNNPLYSTAFSTVLLGAAGEVILDSSDLRDPSAGADYQVSGGWTAYTAMWEGGYQVFLYDPGGTTHRLTQFGPIDIPLPPVPVDSNCSVETLESSGEVTFINGGRRYFASSTVAPVDVAGPNGNAVYIGGAWYLRLGRSLFSIATGIDGGLPDAGTCWPPGLDTGSGAQTPDDDSGVADEGGANDAGEDAFAGSAAVDAGSMNDAFGGGGGGGDAGNAGDAFAGSESDASPVGNIASTDATVVDGQRTPGLGSPGSATDASDDQTVGSSKQPSSSGGSQGGGCSVSAAGQPLGIPCGALLASASALLIVGRRSARRRGWRARAVVLVGVLGTSSRAFAQVVPIITVTSPVAGSVARPQLTLAATCIDSAGNACLSLSAQLSVSAQWAGQDTPNPPGMLVSGVTSINQLVDLSGYDPSFGDQIVFTGTSYHVDENGPDRQSASVSVDIDVHSNDNVTEVEAVAGSILAADCMRLLVLDPDGSTMKIYDRTTQQYAVIGTGLSIPSGPAFGLFTPYLAPGGALFGVAFFFAPSPIHRALRVAEWTDFDPGGYLGWPLGWWACSRGSIRRLVQ